MITSRTGPDRPATPPGPPQPVFCDESGMTGNDLLDRNQGFCTYAGVAVTGERAEEVVRKLLRDYKMQGNELKGKNLVRAGLGRRAIRSLIREVGSETHLVIHHKKYALACKFFEYIFEPVLAKQNSIYYEVGFHGFIANLIYFWTEARQESAVQLLTDFAAYMRSLEPRDNHAHLYRIGQESFEEDIRQHIGSSTKAAASHNSCDTERTSANGHNSVLDPRGYWQRCNRRDKQ
jgi:hypothetical protein